MTSQLLIRAAADGVPPREVLKEILDVEWDARRFRNTRDGQVLRELGAAAQTALACFGDRANEVRLRSLSPDPPDVEIYLPGSPPFVCRLDIVDVLKRDSKPNAEEIELERRTNLVLEAKTEREMLAAIETHLMGKARVRPLSQVATDEQRNFEELRDEARTQLLKKAVKYRARASTDAGFLGRCPFGLILSASPEVDVRWWIPERWVDWLSDDEVEQAAWFPDIILSTTNIAWHRVLAFRLGGRWLGTPMLREFANADI